MLVALDRKARLAPGIARDRGWRITAVARLLVLANDRTIRRRVEAHGAVLRPALPVRGIAVKQWLWDPDRPIAGLLFVTGVPEVNARHRKGAPKRPKGPSFVTPASRQERLSRSP